MGKKSAITRRAPNEASAVTRRLRISPRKLNDVAKSIRGLPAGKALDRLAFSRTQSAQDVRKTLASALANAENNHSLDIDSLVVAQAWTGKSLTLKRWRPRAKGRSSPVSHHFSQITIVVRAEEQV